jgi:ABC-type transporter Mla subunit MlaD
MAAFERQGREVLLGSIIIIGLVLFGVGLFFIESFIDALRDRDEIVAVLPDAPRLTAGAEVWIGGKHVGEVATVAFMPFRGDTMSRIAATLLIPHDVHDQIREDSRIRLTSTGLMGAPVLDISPGTAASPIIEHGDTLYVPQLVTIADLNVKVAAISAAFDSASLELRTLAGPVKSRMASLRPVMRNMTIAQTELASVLDALQNGASADFIADGRFVESLGSLQRTAAELGPAFGQARENMTGAQGDVGQSLKRMQGNAERLSAAIGQLQAMMQNENGTFYRMRADSALVKSLHGVKAQLDSLIIEAKKNPLKFVF